MDNTHPAPEALVEAIAFEPLLHFQLQLGAGMCLEIASLRRAPLYVAGSAGAWLQWNGEGATHAPVALDAGDVAWLPRGGQHRIFTDPHAPVQRLETLYPKHAAERHGTTWNLTLGPAPRHTWSGSFYWASCLAAHPLVAALPPVLVLRRSDATDWLPSLAQLVQWMADLRGGKGLGLTQAMNALMQHLVLAWLRQPGQVATPCAPPHPPSLLRDGRLWPALHAIHTEPATNWTLPALAALCHMSRTSFIQRFQSRVGQSPMRYLAQWRLYLASRLLRHEGATWQQAADAVGYSSGAVLARAFKRTGLRGLGPAPADAPSPTPKSPVT